MDIGGLKYKSFTELEEELGLSKGYVKKIVNKYNIPYKSFGRVNLITDENLTILVEKETKDKENQRKVKSERMKKIQQNRKKSVQKKSGTS
jgi:hypothetical protein